MLCIANMYVHEKDMCTQIYDLRFLFADFFHPVPDYSIFITSNIFEHSKIIRLLGWVNITDEKNGDIALRRFMIFSVERLRRIYRRGRKRQNEY
jgi:hypothetical protein